MNNKAFYRTSQILLLAFIVMFQLVAADGPASQAAAENQDIIQLKAQMAEQQRQIQELRTALAEQRKLIEAGRQAAPAQSAPAQTPDISPTGVRRLGEVASTTPVLPPAAPSAHPLAVVPG